MLAHEGTLLSSVPVGATAFIHADLGGPGKILVADAACHLGPGRPVALMLVPIMHFFADGPGAASRPRPWRAR
jgi:hypothetical protein